MIGAIYSDAYFCDKISRVHRFSFDIFLLVECEVKLVVFAFQVTLEKEIVAKFPTSKYGKKLRNCAYQAD